MWFVGKHPLRGFPCRRWETVRRPESRSCAQRDSILCEGGLNHIPVNPRPLLALALAVTAGLLAGCDSHDHSAKSSPGGGHHHGSAHGGVAVELGDHQFHLDFLHDPAAGTLTAWVMDAHAENFVRVPLPSFNVEISHGKSNAVVTLSAMANDSSGEKVGDTSQFRGESAALQGVTNFTGTVTDIQIRGFRVSGVTFQYPRP